MSMILMIGNGPSVLDRNGGGEIDAFGGDIARFNTFRIDGFEHDVGTRCDVWITTDRFHTWQCAHGRRQVYFMSHDQNPEEQKFLNFKGDMPQAEKIPKTSWERTKQIMEYTAPSSGAVAAYHFSKIYDHVFFYGFDFFQTEQHHYGDTVSSGTLHRPNHELLFFQRMIQARRVIPFLNYTNAGVENGLNDTD